MKINTENSLPLETNATLCEKDVFKFESSSSANMCEFVTKNLYKSPIQTLTQEYLSNARDAQREVDNDHTPIEVTLPTYQEPILKIRDFGPGMDSERIKVLLTFFESTKRGTNKFTGGFGVGAKSAFAYTDSFIIITHVNGTSYHYSAYINEDRFPELAPLSTIPESNKPNGTEIQIPVNQNDVDQFVQAALRCTYFWETKPSFTNLNKELHSWFFRDNAKYKVDNFQILNNESNFKKLFAVNNNYNNSGIIISLDGIPYYVDRELKEKLPAITELQKTLGFGILSVVHLKTGDCEVTGSRESIAQSDYTLQNLKPIFENIINQINIENEKLHKAPRL
jgi:hypothetical protein